MKLVTKSSMRRIVTFGVLIQLLCLGLFTADSVRADCNISTASPNFYAWSENVGWTNWHASDACVTVATTYLRGYMWAENIGWIKLGGTDGPSGSPPQYANDSSTNWGVNRDSGSGALSGYGWSENAGWINFNSTNGGVTWDSGTGKFDGYAWGENIGWIHFQNSSPAYSVYLEGPLVVELTSFTARGFEDHVLLTWETASEIDTAGFHLYRLDGSSGNYVKITNSLIPAEGSATSGATYAYDDTDVTGPRIYDYKLEEVETSGSRSDYGPVSAAVGDAKAKAFTGSGTIDEADTAGGLGDITLEGTGAHTVTTGTYAAQPSGTSALPGNSGWWVVDVTSLSGLTSLTLRFCPAVSTDMVRFWDGKKWRSCSLQAYENNGLRVTITDGTQPKISDMSQLVFALVNGNSQIPTLTQWGLIVLVMLLASTGGLVMRRKES